MTSRYGSRGSGGASFPVRPASPEASLAAFAKRLRSIIPPSRTLEGFAKDVGVSLSALKNWLSAASEPRRDNLLALARAAGVEVQWLACGEGAGRKPGAGEIDTELLSAVLSGIEEWCGPRRVTLKPEKRARLAVLVYEYCALKEDADIPGAVARYARLAL